MKNENEITTGETLGILLEEGTNIFFTMVSIGWLVVKIVVADIISVRKNPANE